MGLRSPHLDDAAFAELWADTLVLGAAEAPAVPDDAHLRACAECRARFTAFTGTFDDLRSAAAADADAVFTAERLAAQQAQIARRLEAADHPARVIAFPALPRPVAAPQRGRQGWVAAGLAAGLFIGIGVGRMMSIGGPDLRTAELTPSTTQQQLVARGSTPAERAIVPASFQAGDELFLSRQDPASAAQALVPESLEYLNAITPGARDYDPR